MSMLFGQFFREFMRIRWLLLGVKNLFNMFLFFLFKLSLFLSFQNPLTMSLSFLLHIQSHQFLFVRLTRVAVTSMHAYKTSPITPFILVWFERIAFFDAGQAETAMTITAARLKKIRNFIAIMTFRIGCVYLFWMSHCQIAPFLFTKLTIIAQSTTNWA